ncbi:MAG: RsmB/NOP family class I SAM-dependent RNA methyltransferase [Tenuifilaceae bacterium]
MNSSTQNTIEAISKGYYEIMEEDRSLDQVCSYWIKQHQDWNSLSRGYFAETLTEVVRWWRLLHTIVNSTFQVKSKEQYRLMVLTYLFIKEKDPVVNEFFSASIKNEIKTCFEKTKEDPAISESIPDWLYKMCSEELGSTLQAELKALNMIPQIVLRVNSLKTTKNELAKKLTSEGFRLSSFDLPYGLILEKRADIYKSKSFFEGLFEQQDSSSQLVAPFLQVEPGMQVIDACAGNGGKTLHIASLMKNKGKILALDNADWKLEELMRRASRAGVSIVEPRLITTTKVVKRLKDRADRLLLDVPCSGLGVLKRNPDSKWRLSHEKIEEIKKTQIQILDRYTQMVKPGGKFVYSTCSILASENEIQVQSFLSRSNGVFILEEEKTISPAQSGFDGFYMARMKRVK